MCSGMLGLGFAALGFAFAVRGLGVWDSGVRGLGFRVWGFPKH